MSADLVVLAAALLLVLDGVHVVHHHRAVGLARAAANRIENRNGQYILVLQKVPSEGS